MNIQSAMPLGGMKSGIQSLDIAYPQGLYAYTNNKGYKIFFMFKILGEQ
jgi:hypothetical protein